MVLSQFDSFEQNDKAKLAQMDYSNDDESEGSDLGRFVFNSKTREVLGRTVEAWGKLWLFWGIFCALLATIWGLSMGIFFQTLDFYIPKYQQSGGVIGSNPALGFRPMRGSDDPYSSLIWFRHGGAGNWDELKQNMNEFLQEYEPGYFANQGASLTKCDFTTPPKLEDEACEFNLEWLSDAGSDIKCIQEENFGYYHGKPCIMIKLNRIYGWQPDPYTIDEIRNHTEMPKALKDDIEKIYASDPLDIAMVWLHCDGEMDPDKENIGTVSYTPFRGFPGYFFPYRNQRGYLSPVVMVQLKNPEPGVLMNLECTAWARNIKHNRARRTGLTHFEFLMD